MLLHNLEELIKDENSNTNTAALAKKSGLNRETLTHILMGRTKNPGIYTIMKIADALNISLDELVGRKPKTQKKSNFNSTIDEYNLFKNVVIYVLSQIENKKEFSMQYFTNCVYEIYRFSIKKGQLDQDFGHWYIENYS